MQEDGHAGLAHAELADDIAAIDRADEAVGNRSGLYIALLAHDLREPLQDAQAAGEKLERQTWDPELRQLAAGIKTQARRMSALIDEVLEQVRGRSSGVMPLHLQTVEDLALRLGQVVRRTLVAHPGRTVVSNITVAQSVRCDGERIEQLASHLLTNALTHGAPAGSVSFVASVEQSQLVLEVWNHGNVIAPTVIKKLFKPFWRRGKDKDRQKVRLGLYVCFEIVRAHFGALNVKSSHADGTTFVARIPLASY